MANNIKINTTMPTTHTQGAVYHIAASGAVTVLELLVVVRESAAVVVSWAIENIGVSSKKANDAILKFIVLMMFFMAEFFCFYIFI